MSPNAKPSPFVWDSYLKCLDQKEKEKETSNQLLRRIEANSFIVVNGKDEGDDEIIDSFADFYFHLQRGLLGEKAILKRDPRGFITQENSYLLTKIASFMLCLIVILIKTERSNFRLPKNYETELKF